MWLAWRSGACLVPAPRSLVKSGMDLGPWLANRGITVVSTVPTLASLWPAETLANVRLLIFGGEACPPELAARLSDEDREVWNTYGPTEATVVTCAAPLDGSDPVRIGLPLDGWDMAIVDPATGVPVADGATGELIIGGVGLARYLDPAKDAEKYAPMPTLGWERAYRSGDLVVMDPEGLIFVGRADEQVKLGGRRIELGEIDASLQALPGVAGGAAAVKDTPAGMQLLIGYLAPEIPGDDQREDWTALLRQELPPALVPRLVLVDDLPTKTSGKVDRNALPWPLPGEEPADGDRDELPESARWFADQWEAVLGTVPTLDSDFFDSGGGSLAAAQLVSRLRTRHAGVTVGDVYSVPRFGALVDVASETDDAAPARARRTITRTRYSMQTLQTLLGIPVHVLAAMKWAVLALVIVNLAGLAGMEVPTVSWWLVVALFGVFVTPWGRMLISAGAARALLRGVSPGTYPRSGSVHLRLWLAEHVGGPRLSRLRRIGAVGHLVRPAARKSDRPERRPALDPAGHGDAHTRRGRLRRTGGRLQGLVGRRRRRPHRPDPGGRVRSRRRPFDAAARIAGGCGGLRRARLRREREAAPGTGLLRFACHAGPQGADRLPRATSPPSAHPLPALCDRIRPPCCHPPARRRPRSGSHVRRVRSRGRGHARSSSSPGPPCSASPGSPPRRC